MPFSPGWLPVSHSRSSWRGRCPGRGSRGRESHCCRRWPSPRWATSALPGRRSRPTAGSSGPARGSCIGRRCAPRRRCSRGRPRLKRRHSTPRRCCRRCTRCRRSHWSPRSHGKQANGWGGTPHITRRGLPARPRCPQSPTCGSSSGFAIPRVGRCQSSIEPTPSGRGCRSRGCWQYGSSRSTCSRPAMRPRSRTCRSSIRWTSRSGWRCGRWPPGRRGLPGFAERGLYRWIGAGLFVALNGVVLRTAHHWGDVPWRLSSQLASKPLQAALTLTWTLTALTAMVAATKRRLRPLWMLGAALLAAVVAKLFLVDLSALSGIAARRRVSRGRHPAAGDRIPVAAAAGGEGGGVARLRAASDLVEPEPLL